MIAALSKTNRLLILALFSMSLVACGFHLRGQVDLPDQLKVITLTSDSGSEDFDRSLRIALASAGVTIINEADATKATYNLKVNAISSSDTELARNASNDVSQVQRRLTSHYFIRQANGKAVYGPRTISTTRTLTNQDAEESAKLSYNQSQMQSMSEDLADQLVYDLNYAPL
ncbi:LPS-assembly lipoprotein [Marinomonas alcarazii]|uniref:LPS-assembly lipoprotein LptE n=1 Tax=Marinomonas alcarazii TaxID=491949 RepID=A0A318V5I7_9GAMM|nr:LPS assembly lipoprotein LptE [Marinomonas alcarazii]PYF83081.1 LPS-assembly lipoprotein [Marinomonas alcarazii]